MADVRLDNRAELLHALDLTGCPEPDDSFLLFKAYEKWGVECGRFLLGDFAFAIWDEARHWLFCCRDHMAIRPFFYWRSGSRLVFASDPLAILAIPEVPRRLNRRKLAGMAVLGGTETIPDETFHAGVLSLPAASWMTFAADGTRQASYWEPEIRENLVPDDEDEAFNALRDLLFKAVECRLGGRGQVAAHLSGGLDSSSIVSIAASSFRESDRRVLAFAVVAPEERRALVEDERDFIDEFRSWRNVDVEYVTAAGRGPFDYIEEPCQFAASPQRFSRFYLYEEFENLAAAKGLDTVLEGSGGEWGATAWCNRYYIELAFRLRWFTLLREMVLMKRRRSVVARLRFLAGQLKTMLPGTMPPFNSGILLAPDFPQDIEPFVPWKCCSPDHRQHQLASIRSRQMWHAHVGQTTFSRIHRSYPLLDKRILEFCIAAPGRMKIRDGHQRYLIRRALAGILPPKIQWRSDKNAFSPDYYFRYNAQLGKARELVASIGPKDPVRSAIDVAKLGRLLEPVDPTIENEIAREVVPRTIYAISFLRQFAEFRA